MRRLNDMNLCRWRGGRYPYIHNLGTSAYALSVLRYWEHAFNVNRTGIGLDRSLIWVKT